MSASTRPGRLLFRPRLKSLCHLFEACDQFCIGHVYVAQSCLQSQPADALGLLGLGKLQLLLQAFDFFADA